MNVGLLKQQSADANDVGALEKAKRGLAAFAQHVGEWPVQVPQAG